ncbi:hypothetical protein VTN96DRAFT_5864 [Rasamsonia emersonii]|uniref:NmrA family transcriptional regulator n=1 Tax=Rasamsonia emersonii (strain ATCC 16479 / CBS 393.64 / IMI 116815) TaxID=1408163 RepID=A0A0F4Z2A0_RASE3|nr:NmrA family transcriptional regulator [Rasamsonia emersonii CBS 393.64]KKA24622.1 NmrA family transcriptional regulator [Rasamsonia emersonii CBS 393.64]
MSKLLVVFGATGQQGGSVANYVISDPELSKQYKLRGVTRDLSKPAAQALQQKGIEVVQADADDIESLKRAMQGAHTVFAVTTTIYDEHTKTREVRQGKALADAAVAAGVQYYIFSTLPHAGKYSGGKYSKVDHFDAKAEVEEYIRTVLPIKSAFFAPGSFMQNFSGMMAPRPVGDGTYAIAAVAAPTTQLPLIDIASDAGKFVGTILAEPDRYEGKVLSSAAGLYTMEEIVQIISKVTGKTVRYIQLSETVFRGFLPPHGADHLVQMLLYFQDVGYFGPKTKDAVDWTLSNVRSKPTVFEEYVARNPPVLE